MFTKIELKWGLIFAFVALLWITLEYLVGLHGRYIRWHPWLTMFFVIPAVVMMVMSIVEKRTVLGGHITFKQAFLCGLGVSIIVGLLTPITQIIFHRFINPGFFESFINYAVTTQQATLEQAQKYFNLTSYIIQGMIFAVIVGAITSLAIAAMIRKEVRNI